jgi:hypothetical protein
VALDKTHQGVLRDPQAATELDNGAGVLVFVSDLASDLVGFGLADREYALDILKADPFFLVACKFQGCSSLELFSTPKN